MTPKTTRTAAFASYGVTLVNPNWSLSGRSEALGIVAVSIWRDEIRGRGGWLFYERTSWQGWYDGPGRREFFENLQYAWDNTGGIVRIVASTREGRVRIESFPLPNLAMRIAYFDATTGAFRLEQVIPEAMAA
jgi:hypothetical protein